MKKEHKQREEKGHIWRVDTRRGDTQRRRDTRGKDTTRKGLYGKWTTRKGTMGHTLRVTHREGTHGEETIRKRDYTKRGTGTHRGETHTERRHKPCQLLLNQCGFIESKRVSYSNDSKPMTCPMCKIEVGNSL